MCKIDEAEADISRAKDALTNGLAFLFGALLRYANLVEELQRADMTKLPTEERLPFFLNLHNAMAIHAVIRVGQPGSVDRRPFFSDFQYVVGGHPYSLAAIRNGILRANRRQPYTLAKPFGSNDRRLEVCCTCQFSRCQLFNSAPALL